MWFLTDLKKSLKVLLKQSKNTSLLSTSVPFRDKIYERGVFKWIAQSVLLMFGLVKLLAFGPLFNAPKSMS